MSTAVAPGEVARKAPLALLRKLEWRVRMAADSFLGVSIDRHSVGAGGSLIRS